MGAAESGRDSHHNSFILLEAVESYGTDAQVDSLRLGSPRGHGHVPCQLQ